MAPADPHSDVTELLASAEAGNAAALDRVLPIVYDELKLLAASYLRAEQAGHTLQTTALVHEAYAKLVGQRATSWQNRGHFFGIAAQAMRQILVDHARRRRALKRSGGKAVTLDENAPGAAVDLDEILSVDEALQRLAALDPRLVRIVELRYFAGLSIEDTADSLGISPATVKRDWLAAKAWLQRELA